MYCSTRTCKTTGRIGAYQARYVLVLRGTRRYVLSYSLLIGSYRYRHYASETAGPYVTMARALIFRATRPWRGQRRMGL